MTNQKKIGIIQITKNKKPKKGAKMRTASIWGIKYNKGDKTDKVYCDEVKRIEEKDTALGFEIASYLNEELSRGGGIFTKYDEIEVRGIEDDGHTIFKTITYVSEEYLKQLALKHF